MTHKSQGRKDVEDRYHLDYPEEVMKEVTNTIITSDLSQGDPRVYGMCTYSLAEILFIIFCGTICGLVSYVDFADFAQEQLSWLRQYMPYKNGVPSHDTIRRIMNLMNPKVVMEYSRSLIRELEKSCNTNNENVIEEPPKQVCGHIVIDGKTVKGHDLERTRLLHSVSAYDVENGISLEQITTRLDNGKEVGEYQCTLQLLDLLELKNKVLSGDAGLCYDEIAQKIVGGHGYYIFTLKENQPTLYSEVKYAFIKLFPYQKEQSLCLEESGKGHGRIENRRYYVLSSADNLPDTITFSGLKSIIMVERERTYKGVTTLTTHYYVSNMQVSDGIEISHCIRAHWRIENSLHHVLDVTFREDDTRARDPYGVENMLIFRRLALSLLNQFKGKQTVPRLMLKALLNPDYRSNIIKKLIIDA